MRTQIRDKFSSTHPTSQLHCHSAVILGQRSQAASIDLANKPSDVGFGALGKF